MSGYKRSLIFVVIDRLRFSRSILETVEKVGKYSPRSITGFGFAIVSAFVFLLAVTRFFLCLGNCTVYIMSS